MPAILSSNTILYCRDWEAARHFYSHILHLEIRFQKDDWFIEYRVGDKACISIADCARCSVEPAPGKALTLSYEVEQLQALHDHFVANKVTVTAINTDSWRAPYFFVRDPEGNRIEFWTARL